MLEGSKLEILDNSGRLEHDEETKKYDYIFFDFRIAIQLCIRPETQLTKTGHKLAFVKFTV